MWELWTLGVEYWNGKCGRSPNVVQVLDVDVVDIVKRVNHGCGYGCGRWPNRGCGRIVALGDIVASALWK